MQRRNVKVLEAAIENAKNSFNVDKMRIDIKKAEGLLARLKKLEGFIHPITKIESDTLFEVRRYTNPRPAIRDVLIATYILLGHDIESAQKWEYLQTQLTKSGRDSLQSLVLHCDTESVPRGRAEFADQLLKPLDLKAVREASNEAAKLYQWASHVIEVKLKETEKEPEKQTVEPKCESVENISEAEVKLIPKRSSVTSRTSSLRSVRPKVDSIRKKGDKAIIPKKFKGQTEAVRSSSERFLWPKR
ncbi:uncharacterized protein LOC133183962 [Saccostrea echinata]|uniref:uncharacterized protein LOC133183962 n=1 Tax=Saccostrea echinata TaxID=191078 RepID=UPI002A7F29A9|nr:uncharacterized protein LOC133183962 [Saccostrea echinata]